MPTHHREGMQKRAFTALVMKQRIVRNDWTKVVLRVMLDAAQEAGVVFKEIPDDDDDLSIPSELAALSDKAMVIGRISYSGKEWIAFSQQEIDFISKNYIHCSANWNSIVLDGKGNTNGGVSASEIIGFVNRPDEHWQRTIYNMDGNKK